MTGYQTDNRLKWVQEIIADKFDGPPSQADNYYQKKLKYITGLIKDHGGDWVKFYDESVGGALVFGKDEILKRREQGIEDYNLQFLKNLQNGQA